MKTPSLVVACVTLLATTEKGSEPNGTDLS